MVGHFMVNPTTIRDQACSVNFFAQILSPFFKKRKYCVVILQRANLKITKKTGSAMANLQIAPSAEGPQI
jgi:hypothetical protein